MTLSALSGYVSNLAPIVGDHLWQSSLVAVAAAALSLGLGKTSARIRYGVWLVASMKFLVPFVLLISLGRALAHPTGRVVTQTVLPALVEKIGQPFANNYDATVVHEHVALRLPLLLFVAWLCGSAMVLTQWMARWRRAVSMRRAGVPAAQGREMTALTRAKRRTSYQHSIELLICDNSFEPGVMGIFRPALLWPAGISAQLDDAHMDAIMMHEVWHARRRDNLAGAIHMLVEVIFWFHPFAWWIGARLLAERERACDEQVLRLCGQPQVYAESILKASKFCVASAVPCVSGVAGSNLEKRVVRIMTQPMGRNLSVAGRLVLFVLGIAVVATPIAIGLFHAPAIDAASAEASGVPAPVLESVSIKPHPQNEFFSMSYPGDDPRKFKLVNCTVACLVTYAYGVEGYLISGWPDWVKDSAPYDIEALQSAALTVELQKLTPAQKLAENKLVAQVILADRFQLKVTREVKDLPVYTLEVAHTGAKLARPAEKHFAPDGEEIISQRELVDNGMQKMTLTGPVSMLANVIGERLQHPVLDRTGVFGTYEMSLSWARNQDEGENLITAVRNQLGLELVPGHAGVDTLIVEQVKPPSER